MALSIDSIKGALGKARKGELPSILITDGASVVLGYSAEMHASRCSVDHAALVAMLKPSSVEQTDILGPGETLARVSVVFRL